VLKATWYVSNLGSEWRSGLKFGVVMFATDYSIDVRELAVAVEERGFESLFLPEHSHIPTDRTTPWPGGAELPRHYLHTIDPFIGLSAAATVTERLQIGTGVCLVVQRDPIDLAKQVSTLDMLSTGRFLFGIGAGWNREEMANHGTIPSKRFAIMRERILAMKEIWANDEAEFHGEHVEFDPIWQWPKPRQRPHPPILVGGDGPSVLDRVLEYGDGWFPLHGRSEEPIAKRIAELNRLAAERGRDPIPVTIFSGPAEHKLVEEYMQAGVDRYVFSVPSAGREQALPTLDRLAELVAMFSQE
jgi:probable F420-dependent oxidoreductase